MRDLQKDSVSALPLSQASLTFNACPSIPLLCAGTGVIVGGRTYGHVRQPYSWPRRGELLRATFYGAF